MATSNFKIFDESYSNIMGDTDYSSNTQRSGGVKNGIADPTLHNKLYRQVSVMAASLAAFVVNNGYDASDKDLSTLTSNFQNAILSVIKNTYQGSIDDTVVPTLDKAVLNTLLSELAYQVKAITGETGWKTSPMQDLKSIPTTYALISNLTLVKRSTAYSVGQIRLDPDIPSWAYLECITAGTTAAVSPSYGVTENAAITDGSVVWTMRNFKSAQFAPITPSVSDSSLKAANTGWVKSLLSSIGLSTGALSSYDFSNGDSWWAKFGGNGGLIVQGGHTSNLSRRNEHTITFPIAYSSKVLRIIHSAQGNYRNNSAPGLNTIYNITLSGFTYFPGMDLDHELEYLSFGI